MFTEPKGGSATWKCSPSVLSFPAATVTICLCPEATPFVARESIALSNPLVPSWGPVTKPKLRLIATGVVPAIDRMSFMTLMMSLVRKNIVPAFPMSRRERGAMPVYSPEEDDPSPEAIPATWVP